MLKVCPGETTIRGIDVSAYQPTISWKDVASTDIEFCFIKATEGATYVSHEFSKQWEGARAAGIMRGAYHFFRPGVDANTQVNNFLKATRYVSALDDLPPVLDWETHSNPKNDINAALFWLREVEKAMKKKPMIYTNPSTFNEIGNPVEFKDYPLWIANYQVKCPFLPGPFKTWKFWQNNDSGTVNGVHGHVDMNLFNGSLDDLRAFAKG